MIEKTYIALHYADEKPQIISESTLISWAEDEIDTYQLKIDNLTVDKAMEILNDIGNVSVIPNEE